MNKKPLIFLVVLIIIVTVGIFLFKQKAKEETPVDSPTNTSAGMRVEDNAVYVQEQKPGTTLTVNTVFLRQPGFVVIHKDNKRTPGVVLGVSSYLPAGEHTNISIKLTSSTQDGQTVYAMLHEDNGDKKFSEADAPVQSKIGGPIMMIVTVDKDASDQSAITL